MANIAKTVLVVYVTPINAPLNGVEGFEPYRLQQYYRANGGRDGVCGLINRYEVANDTWLDNLTWPMKVRLCYGKLFEEGYEISETVSYADEEPIDEVT